MGRPRNTFLVWGGGGHGRVVGELIRAAGHDVAGYIDSDPEKIGKRIDAVGAVVSHAQDDLLAEIAQHGRYPEAVDACALGIGDNRLRQMCLQYLQGLPVPYLVHPTASVSPSAQVGRGSVVFPGAVVNAGARIAEAVIVNSGAIIEHDCVLDSAVHVSPGATLCGGVRVGERSWIGAGATIIQSVVIGSDSAVGAGSTVIRDVADETTVVGAPARCI